MYTFLTNMVKELLHMRQGFWGCSHVQFLILQINVAGVPMWLWKPQKP